MQPAAGDGQPHLPPPQPWMAAPMQYPAATMVMQHHQMMAAQPHFAPPQPYVQFHPAAPPPFQKSQGPPPPPPPPPPHHSSEDNKTIWVGDLHYWMDENYLHSCFVHTGEVNSIKVIRNKQTGQSERYGFVEFFSHTAAENALQSLHGMPMPHADLCFRLNWASFGIGERRQEVGSDFSIFVGDLASDVTDNLLQETFNGRFSSVKGARVVIDPNTGRSKGYGFVRFGDESEKTRAMSEMNGVFCSSRPMRIGAATPRKLSGGFAANGAQGQADGDSSNTTVFVGGLDPNASEEDLRLAFSQFGEIASVKIPVGKQCGFVHFVHRNNAEEALQKLNGTVICNQTVRLSWGRNPANKQARADLSSQWNNDAYYGAPFYNGYGYAAPPPGMYTFACSPYPMYRSQQQVS